MVVPGGTTAEETTPAVLTVRLSTPPVAAITVLAKMSGSSLELDTVVPPGGRTGDDEAAFEVVEGGVPGPSDDRLDWSASLP